MVLRSELSNDQIDEVKQTYILRRRQRLLSRQEIDMVLGSGLDPMFDDKHVDTEVGGAQSQINRYWLDLGLIDVKTAERNEFDWVMSLGRVCIGIE